MFILSISIQTQISHTYTPHPGYSHGGDIISGVLWNTQSHLQSPPLSCIISFSVQPAIVDGLTIQHRKINAQRRKQAYVHTRTHIPNVRRASPGPSAPVAAASAAARVFSSLNTLIPGTAEEDRAQARPPIGWVWCHFRVPSHNFTQTPSPPPPVLTDASWFKETVLFLCTGWEPFSILYSTSKMDLCFVLWLYAAYDTFHVFE